MDIWSSLDEQMKNTDAHRERAAIIRAKGECLSRYAKFLSAGDKSARLEYIDDEIRAFAYHYAEQFSVDPLRVYAGLAVHLAETAVTEPKREKVTEPTGGPEGEKYKNQDKVPDDVIDAKADIMDLDPVLVEQVGERVLDKPKRHKREQVDLNEDTDKQ